MNKVGIVILNYNGWAMVHQLLMDIYQKCSLPLIEEVLVVNNGCTEDASFTGLNWWIHTKTLPIRELRLEENLHFIGGFNAGLKEVKGDILVALSNDVRIYGDIVQFLYDLPTTDFVGGRYLDWDTGWNTFDGKIYPYLEGWLLAAHRWAWEGVGYFDERYKPNDMEDIDLSTKALSLDYSLITFPEGHAIHLGGQTYRFTPEREQTTIRNKEKFKAKWVTKVSP